MNGDGYMKATFMQRLLAYLLDMIIVGVVLMFMGIFIPGYNSDDSQELSEELVKVENNLVEVMQSGDKDAYDDTMQNVIDIEYKISKTSVLSNTISFIIIFGYFVILQFMLKGKTIGKMLMKIRIVDKKKNEPSFWTILYRNFIVFGLLTSFLSLILIIILPKNAYVMFNTILNIIESIFVIVSALMILYRKDKRGLHDMMAGTSVIKDE